MDHYTVEGTPVDTEVYIDRFLTFLDGTKSLFTRTADNAILFFEENELLGLLNQMDESC